MQAGIEQTYFLIRYESVQMIRSRYAALKPCVVLRIKSIADNTWISDSKMSFKKHETAIISCTSHHEINSYLCFNNGWNNFMNLLCK